MSRYSSRDHYVDPVSGVLKNRFGITDAAELEQTEASTVSVRSLALSQKPIAGKFDLAHLRAIHRYLFGDVYEWAGQLRDVDISKGDSHFAHYSFIESAAADIFAKLARERHLAGLTPAAFSARTAHYLGELNALHPFREGNGRALREFVTQLAKMNGYTIAWKNITQEQMLAASIQSFDGDPSRLAALIQDNLQSGAQGELPT